MNYQEALQIHDELESKAEQAHKEMSKYPREGAMKLTPDHIKRTPEWKRDDSAFWAASKALRDFNNKVFLKNYRKEFQATLSERRKAKNAA